MLAFCKISFTSQVVFWTFSPLSLTPRQRLFNWAKHRWKRTLSRPGFFRKIESYVMIEYVETIFLDFVPNYFCSWAKFTPNSNCISSSQLIYKNPPSPAPNTPPDGWKYTLHKLTFDLEQEFNFTVLNSQFQTIDEIQPPLSPLALLSSHAAGLERRASCSHIRIMSAAPSQPRATIRQ